MATDLKEAYHTDFYAWTLNQAHALRRWAEERPSAAFDLAPLIDEVEGLARERRNVVLRNVGRLIGRLLQLEYSPSARPRYHWLNGVDRARFEIGLRLTPTVRPEIEASLPDCYRFARRSARLQLLDRYEHQAADALPPDNPYPLDRLLDKGWYPKNVHGIAVVGEEHGDEPAADDQPRRP